MGAPDFTDLLAKLTKSRPRSHPIFRFDNKMFEREFVKRLGMRQAALLNGPCSLFELVPPTKPFILKPVIGSSCRGVTPLIPQLGSHPCLYRNVWNGREETWAEWRRHAKQFEGQVATKRGDTVGPDWLIEELISGNPFDWKVWVVGGKATLVWQIRRPDKHSKLWSPMWEHLGKIALVLINDASLPPPKHGAAIIETAERLARHIDSPFIRIDLYEDAEGPIFGEIDPHPSGGARLFNDEWERKLGSLWPRSL